MQAFRQTGVVDAAAVAYGAGCLYFLDDAFGPVGWHQRWLKRLKLNSYQAGSIAYAVGTLVWGGTAALQEHRLDAAAALYALGCVYFLIDAFALAAKRPRWLTSQQLGAIAFLLGTVVWAVTGGLNVPVAAYGLGCVLFVRDAWQKARALEAGTT